MFCNKWKTFFYDCFLYVLFTAVPKYPDVFIDNSAGEEDLPDITHKHRREPNINHKLREDGTHTTDTDDEASNGDDDIKPVGMTEKMQLEAIEFLKENPFLWDKGNESFKNKRRRTSNWVKLGKMFNLTGK